MSNNLQRMLDEIVRAEEELSKLDRIIVSKLNNTLEKIDKLTPEVLGALILAQETRSNPKHHFVFSMDVINAFYYTPYRKWYFFKNKEYPGILDKVRKTVRRQILNSNMFFFEQIKALELTINLEKLKVTYANALSEAALEFTDKTVTESLRSHKSIPSIKENRHTGKQTHIVEDRFPSETITASAEIDPLSPLSPLSPFNLLNTGTQPPGQNRHEECTASSYNSRETESHHNCAPYENKVEMQDTLDSCNTSDQYGSYS